MLQIIYDIYTACLSPPGMAGGRRKELRGVKVGMGVINKKTERKRERETAN